MVSDTEGHIPQTILLAVKVVEHIICHLFVIQTQAPVQLDPGIRRILGSYREVSY